MRKETKSSVHALFKYSRKCKQNKRLTIHLTLLYDQTENFQFYFEGVYHFVRICEGASQTWPALYYITGTIRSDRS